MTRSSIASRLLWQQLHRASSSSGPTCWLALPLTCSMHHAPLNCNASLLSVHTSTDHQCPDEPRIGPEQGRCSANVTISNHQQLATQPTTTFRTISHSAAWHETIRHNPAWHETISHNPAAWHYAINCASQSICPLDVSKRQRRHDLQPQSPCTGRNPTRSSPCCGQHTGPMAHIPSRSQGIPTKVGQGHGVMWGGVNRGHDWLGRWSRSSSTGQCRALSTSTAAATETVDCVVVGAGVVGLACARTLALAGCEVVVLEEEARFGQGTSSRSSEVVHAGIYYPAGSLKARVCVEGKHMLYEYCRKKDVPFKNMGKLIVATNDSQNARLGALKAAGTKNNVNDLELISKADAEGLEPALYCTAALWSPSTGIVDSHSFMEAMLGDVEEAGGILAVNTKVVAVDASRNPFAVKTKDTGSGEESVLYTKMLVNAAGLGAQQVSHRTTGLSSSLIPPQFLAKGNYFTQKGSSPFTRLIYPLPEPGGIGVHLTLDLAGKARFGPDVEWVDSLEYSVNPRRGDVFYSRIREYYPALPDDSLEPAYCGIRPKIVGPDGEGWTDFMVQGADKHGVKGLVNLFGIESPGITSSMAIGQHVAGLLLRKGP